MCRGVHICRHVREHGFSARAECKSARANVRAGCLMRSASMYALRREQCGGASIAAFAWEPFHWHACVDTLRAPGQSINERPIHSSCQIAQEHIWPLPDRPLTLRQLLLRPKGTRTATHPSNTLTAATTTYSYQGIKPASSPESIMRFLFTPAPNAPCVMKIKTFV